jgi:hypothetical protein
MPYDEPDETDPMMLVGVELPADGLASLETAMVFAEEFARMGFDEEKLMGVFRNPFYAGAHQAYRALGEEKVAGIVRENVRFWGAVRFRERESDPATGLRLLPVLERKELTDHV